MSTTHGMGHMIDAIRRIKVDHTTTKARTTMKIDTIGDYEAATQQRAIEQAEANMREGRMSLAWCDECYLYAAKIDVQTGHHEFAHAYLNSYSIALAMESGEFDTVERFTAATDAAANAYAEAEYDHLEWYVLDKNGSNINA